MLKQDLASAHDYNIDYCYKQIDDCNFGKIDIACLRRFLVKCCIYASDPLLMAIVRRMDLDGDCKLSQSEFESGIIPVENFTKATLAQLKTNLAVVKNPKSNYKV